VISIPDEAILEELREQERLARQFIVFPYQEVKETLDKLAAETAMRSTAAFAAKCEREAAA